MERRKLLTLVSHAIVVVFAVIGCIVSECDYSYDRESLRPVIDLPSAAADLPFQNKADNSYEPGSRRAKVSNLIQLSSDASRYWYDPKTLCLVPFLATLLVMGSLMVAAACCRDFYKTTPVFNCSLLLWLTHFSYMISSLQRIYVPEKFESFYYAPKDVIAVLHGLMLCLLIFHMVNSGRYLKGNQVKWPVCRGLKIFTIDTICIFLRLGFSTVVFFVTQNSFSYGLYTSNRDDERYCIDFECARVKVPEFAFYTALGTSFAFLVFSIENFLSHLWGVGHRTLNIAVSFVSGWVSIILPSIYTLSFYKSIGVHLPEHVRWFWIITGVLHIFHSWNMWYNWKFISSPPSVLQLLCGSKQAIENDEDIDDEGENEVHNGERGIESNREDPTNVNSVITHQAKPAEKGRCLVVNIFLAVLCLVLVSLLGFDMDEYMKELIPSEILLEAVLTSCIIKSFSALATLIATKNAPPASALQLFLDLFVESIVLIAAVVGVLVSWQSVVGIVASWLTILVVVIKILNVVKANAVQTLIAKLSSEYGVPHEPINSTTRDDQVTISTPSETEQPQQWDLQGRDSL